MEFWEWFAVAMGGGVLTIGAVFAFRVNVSFDVNDWIKDRRKRKLRKLRDVCPHAAFVETPGGESRVQVLLVQPALSRSLVCTRCGAVDRAGVSDLPTIAKYWASNPREYRQRMKEYERLTVFKPRRWWAPWR